MVICAGSCNHGLHQQYRGGIPTGVDLLLQGEALLRYIPPDCNALRLAGSLARRPGEEVTVFLMGKACELASRGLDQRRECCNGWN